MLKYARQLLAFFSRSEKWRLALVLMGAMFSGFLEVIGIGSIMPFISVATNPEMIRRNGYLSWGYAAFGFSSDRDFLIALGIGVVVFLVLSNAFKALFHYAMVRFTSMRRHSFALRLFKGYLGQPYPFFLNRASHEFVKNVITETVSMVNGFLVNCIQIASQIIQVTLIAVFLFIVNPAASFMIVIVVGTLYAGIYGFIRRTLRRLGAERFEINAAMYRIVSEAFWGIKDVKLLGKEQIFASQYATPSKRLARNEAISEVMSEVPKFVLETGAFASIMIFVVILISNSGDFQTALAVVAMYVYAGYRLMPAIQQLFRSATKIRYSSSGTEFMLKEFAGNASASLPAAADDGRLPIASGVELEGITFSYPSSKAPVVSGASLRIGVNTAVGFAGKTGSGKTTLVDIVLGLLRQQTGRILVDGTELTDANLRLWQNNIGYVPQQIYLSDDSIEANIAFGIPRDRLDRGAVERAARIAQIHDFILSDLPEKYLTKVGERGVRLSGGQRQRIGIARALYHDPAMLVLDEATSALDGHTEDAVMEAIEALSGKKTILIIAHRLTTLRKCDMIYLLERGAIVDSGRYDELEARSKYFRHK